VIDVSIFLGKRVSAALGEGSAAVRSVHEYLAFTHPDVAVPREPSPSDLQRA